APHAQEAEFAPCAPSVAADMIEVFQLGGDVVRRYNTVSERRSDDLAFCAHYDRVSELSRTRHFAPRQRSVVGGDEIHDAEVDRFHTVERGDFPDFTQRAVSFDQHMGRDLSSDVVFALAAA